ncbi:transcriptional regulator, SARP family [Kribbella flavida DSM 17836]|uniref:Transcriptional regulator, SARP family n=1 Tax=Kribbella flavida (strain DSM 17836 / JCM 10339 / NBRC 14399) TaxID=479435 RepID=D2PQ33_KRIFD|nr:AfsR/SARP family transcriptional regulator [Kribbella flavida]ADB32957.1 transcriptional regulator, SARP family [Kribbella flavida DSM 17836]
MAGEWTWMAGEVRFHILRPLAVEAGGRQIAISGKPRLLLATLLLRAGTPVTLDRLADILWGHQLPRNVRPAIHTLVCRLRAAVGDDHELVQRTPAGYRIDLATDRLDLLEFRRLLAAAAAASDQRRELELLTEALGHWYDGALTGFDSDQLEREDLAALGEVRLTALERRIELELQLGGGTELLAELRQVVAEHPLRERLWAYLIRALSQGSRQSDALAAYREVRGVLAEQLGIAPGRELRDAHETVLRGHSTRRNRADRAAMRCQARPQAPRQGMPLSGRR